MTPLAQDACQGWPHLQLSPQVEAAKAGCGGENAAHPRVCRGWWSLLPIYHKWLLLETQPVNRVVTIKNCGECTSCDMMTRRLIRGGSLVTGFAPCTFTYVCRHASICVMLITPRLCYRHRPCLKATMATESQLHNSIRHDSTPPQTTCIAQVMQLSVYRHKSA